MKKRKKKWDTLKRKDILFKNVFIDGYKKSCTKMG